MGLLHTVVTDDGVLRLADVLLSTVGLLVALWFMVHWGALVGRN